MDATGIRDAIFFAMFLMLTASVFIAVIAVQDARTTRRRLRAASRSNSNLEFALQRAESRLSRKEASQ